MYIFQFFPLTKDDAKTKSLNHRSVCLRALPVIHGHTIVDHENCTCPQNCVSPANEPSSIEESAAVTRQENPNKERWGDRCEWGRSHHTTTAEQGGWSNTCCPPNKQQNNKDHGATIVLVLDGGPSQWWIQPRQPTNNKWRNNPHGTAQKKRVEAMQFFIEFLPPYGIWYAKCPDHKPTKN